MVEYNLRLDLIFSSLADPTRRDIFQRVTSSDLTISEIAKRYKMSFAGVAKHLRVLEKARLIDRRREGRVHVIRVRGAGFKQAQDWMARCAAGWDFSFDALDELLKQEQRKGKTKDEVGSKHQR